MKNIALLFKKTVSLLLCLAMLCSFGVFAFAEDKTDTGGDSLVSMSSVDGDRESILNSDELKAMVEEFIKKHDLKPEKFAIGYCYTATGDEWYYNGDRWFYPASMYKVPLMMQVAEKVRSGELQQEGNIYDLPVSRYETTILTYSNNDFAHTIRKYLGGDEVWREYAKSYARLEDSEYDPDYMQYCYFSARYMTQVMETLYYERDRFPNIIECLLEAEPTHYFRLSDKMNKTYGIAQKYGSFCDQLGQNFNHTTGIVYTPNPCIITVMTLDASDYEYVISEAAKMFTEYTLKIDDMLESFKAEQEKKRLEEEAAERAAAEKKAEDERIAKEQAAAEREAAKAAELKQAQQSKFKKLLTIVGAGVGAIALIAIFAAVVSKILSRKREEEMQRRFEREQNALRAKQSAQVPERRNVQRTERRASVREARPRSAAGPEKKPERRRPPVVERIEREAAEKKFTSAASKSKEKYTPKH